MSRGEDINGCVTWSACSIVVRRNVLLCRVLRAEGGKGGSLTGAKFSRL